MCASMADRRACIALRTSGQLTRGRPADDSCRSLHQKGNACSHRHRHQRHPSSRSGSHADDGVCMWALPCGVGALGSCFEIFEILTHLYRPAETFSMRAVEDCENDNLRDQAGPSKSGREKGETQRYTGKAVDGKIQKKARNGIRGNWT